MPCEKSMRPSAKSKHAAVDDGKDLQDHVPSEPSDPLEHGKRIRCLALLPERS